MNSESGAGPEKPKQGKAGPCLQGVSTAAQNMLASGMWKGENESDANMMEADSVNPLANAGAWGEDEAFAIYREKLLRLRELYIGQFSRITHVLQERRRQFLLESQAKIHSVKKALPCSAEEAALRCYQKRSPEEALLERRQKLRRLALGFEQYHSRKELREANRGHVAHLLHLQQELGYTIQPPCSSQGCDNPCMPFANRCSRHICDDHKQVLYTKCSYVYPSGVQCSKPVPLYLQPQLLCGGHCNRMEMDLLHSDSGCKNKNGSSRRGRRDSGSNSNGGSGDVGCVPSTASSTAGSLVVGRVAGGEGGEERGEVVEGGGGGGGGEREGEGEGDTGKKRKRRKPKKDDAVDETIAVEPERELSNIPR